MFFNQTQVGYRGSLNKLSGSAVDPFLSVLLESINAEVTIPFRLTASVPVDRAIHIGNSIITNPTTGEKHASTVLGTDIISIASGTVTLPATSGGTVTVSPGNNTTMTVSNGNYIKGIIYVDSSSMYNVLFGTQAASEAAATIPQAPANTHAIGYFVAHNTAGLIDNITTANIYQFTNNRSAIELSSIVTVLADANKVIRRDAAGAVISGNSLPNSSAIVTIDAAQVITAKDIDGGTASNTSRITIPKDTLANLQSLTRKEGTIVYATDTKLFYEDNGTSLIPVGSSSGSGSKNYVTSWNAEDSTGGLAGWGSYNDSITVTSSAGLVDEANDTISIDSSQMYVGLALHYSASSPIGGLTDATVYYVALGSTFAVSGLIKLSTTLANAQAGTVINLISDGSGNHTFSPLVPLDGNNGSLTSGHTLTITTSSPLRDVKSFLITKPALDVAGEGFNTPITIDNTDKNKALYLSMDLEPDSNYIVDTYQFFLVNITTGLVQKFNGSINNNRLTMVAFTDSNTTYRLVIHCTSGNTTAMTLKFDTVILGPDKLLDSTIETFVGIFPFTPTGGGTATYTEAAMSIWRKGENAKIDFNIKVNAAGNGAVAVNIPLPSGMTWNSARKSSSTAEPIGTLALTPATLYANSTYSYVDANGIKLISGVSLLTGTELAAGAQFEGTIEIPILEWANQAVLSTADMMNVVGSVSAGRGSNQTGVNPNGGNYVKININSYFNGDSSLFDSVNSRIILRKKTRAFVKGSITLLGTNVLNSRYAAVIFVNGSTRIFGATITPLAGTNTVIDVSGFIEVNPNDYIELYIYGIGNNSVNTLTVVADNTATFLQMFEIPDLFVYSTYGQTEFVTSELTSYGAWGFTAGTFGDATSIDLTPGEWDLTGVLTAFSNGAVSTTTLWLAITTVSGNSSSGMVNGRNLVLGQKSQTAQYYDTLVIPTYNVTVTVPTTYYLKVRGDAAVANLQRVNRISARRIK